MKNFAKKAVAFLLAFVMLFLVACNNDNNGSQYNNGSAPQATGQPPSDGGSNNGGRLPDQPHGHIHPGIDMGGRTLYVGGWWNIPASSGGIWGGGEEPNRATEANYPVARLIWDNARRVEQLFNVRFEGVVVDYGEFFPTLASSVIGGNPIADLVWMEGFMQMDGIGSVIQPWDSANLPNSDVLGNQIFAGPILQDDRHIWSIDQNGIEERVHGLIVNLDIINQDGLPNPVDLFESGEWTWERMLYIMRRATRATTPGGVIDQFGIGGQPGDIVQHLIGANDGVMVDANLNYGFGHENTLETLEFVEQIFSERLWASEGGGETIDPGNHRGNFFRGYNDGNVAMFVGVPWALEETDIAFDFAFVPFPVGPSNTTGSTWLRGIPDGFAVPVGVDWEIEHILMILEELWAWPGDEPELLFEAGDIDWFNELFLTEGDVARAVHMSVTAGSDIGLAVGTYYWILGMFASHFWNRELDVRQAVEYLREPHQEMLDRRFRP